MRRISDGAGLEEAILRGGGAGKFHEPNSLPTELEKILGEDGSDLDPEHLERARGVAGIGTEALREIRRRSDEDTNLARIRQLANEETAAMAGAVPERLFATDDPDQQWAALMEIFTGVNVDNADLSWFENFGASIACNRLITRPRWIQKLIIHAIKNRILDQVGGFVKIFKTEDAEKMIDTLEKESLITGIGYEANFVTESARSEGEARRNIEWNKAAIRRIARGAFPSYEAYAGIAIKPTSLVAFSDSAIARLIRQKQLTKALCEILQVANGNRLPDGKSVMITIDSERSDIFDMVGKAVLAARREFPKVRVQVAMQAYHRGTEELLLNPFLSEQIEAGDEPLGARLVNGANLHGEAQLHDAMGWHRGIPLANSRAETHSNRMHLREVMTDPVKDGGFNLTLASMNIYSLVDDLIGLARAGVFAARNHGYISLAMLRNMTGQETFRYFMNRFQAMIAMPDGKFKKDPLYHEYIPVIGKATIIELFKYYLRRVEELVGEAPDGEVANFLGDLAQHGPHSAKFLRHQVGHGVVSALRHHQEQQGAPLDPLRLPYRGKHEPLIVPASRVEQFQALRDTGVEVVGTSLTNFQITPALAPGSLEDENWIDELISDCENRTEDDALNVQLQFPRIEGDPETREVLKLKGPTRPDLLLGTYELATEKDIDKAFEITREDESKWSARSPESRIATIVNVTAKMRERRATLCKALMMNTGKSVPEADAEVCEAMDFLTLSALQMQELLELDDSLEFGPGGNGVEVVIGPKNFPIAIPLEQITKALLMGERVIFKPSGGEGEESFEAGYELCKCLWDAGVPKHALVFLPCDNKKAAYLTKKAEKCKYTGSAEVAYAIWTNNEDIDLTAETGGPNVCIVDSTMNLKAVATEIIFSVCQFGGQKCSKPVMIMLTGDVDLEAFKKHLLGQMLAMLTDTALKRNVDNTGLSRTYPPEHPFCKKVMECLPGEEWVKGQVPTGHLTEEGQPEMMDVSAQPQEMGDIGIRFVADPEHFDWQRLDEIFAPIVSFTQIKGNTENAIDIVGKLKGALTGTLYSQNRASIIYARKHWKTGNLYFGRKQTAARADQGFGDGVGVAHFGAHGVKTGTPEYLIMGRGIRRKKYKYAKYDTDKIPDWKEPENDDTGLAKALGNLNKKIINNTEQSTPQRLEELTAALHAGRSYLHEHANYYSQNRPTPYQVRGQYDWIESHAVGEVIYRVTPGDSLEDILCKIFSTLAARNTLHLSLPPAMNPLIELINNLLEGDIKKLFPKLHLSLEDDEKFAGSIETIKPACILYSDRKKVPAAVWTDARKAKVYIDGRKATGHGRVDMITQYRQQSFCWVYHVAGDTGYEEAIRRHHGLDPEWGVPYEKIDPAIEAVQCEQAAAA